MASSASAFPHLAKNDGDSLTDEPKVGEFRPAGPNDLRSPCPAINALANHGYLPRDGRNIDEETFIDVILKHIGLSADFTAVLASNALKVNIHDPPSEDHPIKDWLGIGRSLFGTRHEGQVDPETKKPVINLDNLDRHGAIEHDISLTRNDIAQGDNHSKQPALLEEFFAAAKDGEFLTRDDIAEYRRLRYQQQKDWYAAHPDKKLTFGIREEILAFGEASLIEGILGWEYKDQEYKIPVKYLKAFFGEERLPLEEGWTPRSGTNALGIAEGNIVLAAIKWKAGFLS